MNRRKCSVCGFGLIVSSLALLACSAALAQGVVTMQTEAEDAAEARIYRLLETTVSFDFQQLSLQEAIGYLSTSTGLPILIDLKGLEDASIGPDTPVTCEVQAMTLRSALRTMLGAMDLTYVIKRESLVVTTPEKAGNELFTRVYLVYDLVVSRNGDRTVHNYQQLIDLITATIAPTTWDEVGGPGAIHEYRVSAALVVSQTREVHEQIEPLLAGLRSARDLQHMNLDRHAAPRRSPGPAPWEPAELREPPRYVLKPNAGWLVPRTHE